MKISIKKTSKVIFFFIVLILMTRLNSFNTYTLIENDSKNKEKGFIKPSIILPPELPKFKSIAKSIDENDFEILSHKGSIASSNNFKDDSKHFIDSDAVTESDSESKSNFDESFTSYLESLNKKGYKKANLISDISHYKFLKDDKTKESNSDSKINKNSSNVYFANDDIDYLVNKKIRESNLNENFTKIKLKKEVKVLEKKDEKSNDLEKNIDKILKLLKQKIIESPNDYEFYFKDAQFEIKEYLLSNSILHPNSFHLYNENEKKLKIDIEDLRENKEATESTEMSFVQKKADSKKSAKNEKTKIESTKLKLKTEIKEKEKVKVKVEKKVESNLKKKKISTNSISDQPIKGNLDEKSLISDLLESLK